VIAVEAAEVTAQGAAEPVNSFGSPRSHLLVTSVKRAYGWQTDGVCDDVCATNFPADHFDDAADCM
jgi:hypothetical protein